MRCFLIFLSLFCIGLFANSSYAPYIKAHSPVTYDQEKSFATTDINEFQYAATNDLINDNDDLLQSADDDDEECGTEKHAPPVREASIPVSLPGCHSPHPSTIYSFEEQMSTKTPLRYLEQRSLRI